MKFRLTAFAAVAAGLVGIAAVPASGQSLKTYRHIILDGHQVKWGSPSAGTGAVVTYARLRDAREFPMARNCKAMAPIEPLLAASGLSMGVFDAELEAAFALWSDAANIRFVAAKSPASADILIGAQAEPRGRAFTNIEYEPTGPGDIRRLTRSTICLNPEERWKIGFDGNLEVYDLRYALLHEIGHAIGLDHPSIDSQLMDFRYLERFRTPQEGDILGAAALYGPSGTPGPLSSRPAQARRLVDTSAPELIPGG
ncbi:MAG TPA: matrixin family metalloprotease [Bauldia sp.]|nr:matrixin family metalloprotease [Bauldia sp.]